MMFTEAMKRELNENTLQCTENGALGYATSGKYLLDLNFAVSSLRNSTDEDIIKAFTKAFYETPGLAIKWLFFARDIRGGLGERRLFRVILKHLANEYPGIVSQNLSFIPEYGRWDDLFVLFGTKVEANMIMLVKEQFFNDLHTCRESKPISLLAKWMPSANSKKIEMRDYAKRFAFEFGFGIKKYRQTLSELRTYLDVVEKKMSANEWSAIEYEKVPSKANILYSDAFYRHEMKRRFEYLVALSQGKTKINASVLFPHDIVAQYRKKLTDGDETFEQLWKNLPDYVCNNSSTLVVADGSGSMCCRIGNTNTTALDVAKSLAIYFSERCTGEFKDKFITFSMNPKFVDLSNCNDLRSKIKYSLKFDECENTNIEAVFDLILNTAVKNNMKQEDIPSNILIISDMEFDRCACYGEVAQTSIPFYGPLYTPVDEALFTTIGKKYEAAGYKLPRLIFWNVASRTNTIPVQQNALGVALVSGFSPAIAKMVTSSELDPFKCLLEQLTSERYKPIQGAYLLEIK